MCRRFGPANTGQALGGHKLKAWCFLGDVFAVSLVCIAVFTLVVYETDHAHVYACC